MDKLATTNLTNKGKIIEQLPVNCINLPHRELRRQQSIEQADEQGFYIKFWDGIVFPHDRKRGINLAHRQIIKEAKDLGYKNVCVMEDDCRFFAPKAWEYFLENMPDDFDIYFGMLYIGDLDSGNRVQGLFSAMTLYVVNSRFYDFFLSLPESCHVDRELGLTSNIHKYIVCDKFCCYQDGSRSDNNFLTCDYSPYLEGRRIYGKD